MSADRGKKVTLLQDDWSKHVPNNQQHCVRTNTFNCINLVRKPQMSAQAPVISDEWTGGPF